MPCFLCCKKNYKFKNFSHLPTTTWCSEGSRWPSACRMGWCCRCLQPSQMCWDSPRTCSLDSHLSTLSTPRTPSTCPPRLSMDSIFLSGMILLKVRVLQVIVVLSLIFEIHILVSPLSPFPSKSTLTFISPYKVPHVPPVQLTPDISKILGPEIIENDTDQGIISDMS